MGVWIGDGVHFAGGPSPSTSALVLLEAISMPLPRVPASACLRSQTVTSTTCATPRRFARVVPSLNHLRYLCTKIHGYKENVNDIFTFRASPLTETLKRAPITNGGLPMPWRPPLSPSERSPVRRRGIMSGLLDLSISHGSSVGVFEWSPRCNRLPQRLAHSTESIAEARGTFG